MDNRQVRRYLRDWGDTANLCARRQRELRELYLLAAEAGSGLPDRASRRLRGAAVAEGEERAVEAREKAKEKEKEKAAAEGGGEVGALALAMVERYHQEARRVAGEIEQLLQRQRQVDRALEDLDAAARQILYLRYVEKRSWCSVAIKSNYAEASARRIEVAALRQLARKLNSGNR